jgi:hypothetical protein
VRGGIYLDNGWNLAELIPSGSHSVSFKGLDISFTAIKGEMSCHDINMVFEKMEAAGLLPDVRKD